MTILDSAMRETASRLLGTYGKELTLRRDVRSDYRPASGDFLVETHIDDTFRGFFVDYNAKQIDGTLVQAGDRQVLAAAKDLPEAPRAGDHVMIDAETWDVIHVKADWSGEQVALYTMQVRK